ncbi:transcriptional regulator [Globicatella sp. HMSC072A10]|uniref:LytTR family DNA-binding domain-containing protein n=1 Tax=Globicatella sp. HMSC072A10 TaxID=1739315 RepID=UPI0008AB6DD5|nr:LytTR family DNA-binding domain-containing protein [Globicatella sp. HMSC072A10]OFK61798.1 transcriptional regulator [Globicatella sp. HMSC072A10]
MRKEFKVNNQISASHPLVTIQAESLTDEAKAISDYLDRFGQLQVSTIPIKSDDQILMIKIDQIIMADIQQNTLMIYSVDGVYQTTETLKRFEQRLNRAHFIQVSKHAILNLDHLHSLSNSFSGNMMAKLTNGYKTSVSRKYVKALMECLGL